MAKRAVLWYNGSDVKINQEQFAEKSRRAGSRSGHSPTAFDRRYAQAALARVGRADARAHPADARIVGRRGDRCQRHHLAEKVKAYCASRKGTAKITVSVEEEILGTGGVLNPLRGFLGDDAFWLVNGDIVIEELDPEPIADAFARSGGFAACWLREDGPRTVEADPEGRICNWHSDDAGAPGTYTYCGCAMLGPEIFGYVAPEGFSTIVDAYEKAMMDSRFVVGAVINEAFCWDAGTP